jgi:hypothetical protein
MHENKTLLERILYKYEYVGYVEKDGNVLKKYKKVKRFPMLGRGIKIVLYLLFGAALVYIAQLLSSITLFNK